MKNDRIILKNVNVFDGISDELQENCMVVMEKGLIREIIKSDCENVENAKVIGKAVRFLRALSTAICTCCWRK